MVGSTQLRPKAAAATCQMEPAPIPYQLSCFTLALHSRMASYQRHLISSGSTFEAQIGYSRAVVAGDWIMVSGTTGFDYSNMTISDDLEAQTEQCFRNINAALEQAGSSLGDIVRVHYILPDASTFPACWPVLRKYLGNIRPAATMFEARLADPRMKIEIEVTALRGSATAAP